eukprot:gene9499-biopygen21239
MTTKSIPSTSTRATTRRRRRETNSGNKSSAGAAGNKWDSLHKNCTTLSPPIPAGGTERRRPRAWVFASNVSRNLDRLRRFVRPVVVARVEVDEVDFVVIDDCGRDSSPLKLRRCGKSAGIPEKRNYHCVQLPAFRLPSLLPLLTHLPSPAVAVTVAYRYSDCRRHRHDYRCRCAPIQYSCTFTAPPTVVRGEGGEQRVSGLTPVRSR